MTILATLVVSTALGALVVSTALGAASGGPLPGPATVRETAREILARPEYHLDTPDLNSVWDALRDLIERLLGYLRNLFEWLNGMSPVLAWTITVALVVTLSLLLGHILWTLATAVRRNRQGLDALAESSRRKVDPTELAREADHAGASGNYILGVRLLYRACLTRLEQTEEKAFRPGATNREHLNRYRATPLYDWLFRLVSIIDLKWYGAEPCLATDFAECRDAYEHICLISRGTTHAHPA